MSEPHSLSPGVILARRTGVSANVRKELERLPSNDEIQAKLVENILAGSRLIRPAAAGRTELAAFVLFAVLLAVVMPRMHPGAGVALFAAAALLMFTGEVSFGGGGGKRQG